MNAGSMIVLAVDSWGIVRIRINSDMDLSSASKDKIRMETCGSVDYGHQNAFTYKVEHVDFERLMASLQDTVNFITETIKNDKDELRF